jgi:hypothetical protein
MPLGVQVAYRYRLAEGAVLIVGALVNVKVRLLVPPVGLACSVPGTGEVYRVVISKYRTKGAVFVIVNVQQLLIKKLRLVS